MAGTPRRRWVRVRAVCGGMAAAFGVLWGGFCFWHLGFTYYGEWTAALTLGSVGVEVFTPPLQSPHRLGGHDVATSHWRSFRRDFRPIWWPKWYRSGPPVPLVSVSLPLWIPAAGFGGAAWMAHRRIRRIDAVGKCRCGYDRAGLKASAPCPECGRGA